MNSDVKTVAEIKTCRHFRYLLPQDEADELRLADPMPCEVCDPLMRRRGIQFEEHGGFMQPVLFLAAAC
jgi:hypothetical protein